MALNIQSNTNSPMWINLTEYHSVNLLSANLTKWSNKLKKFVGFCRIVWYV